MLLRFAKLAGGLRLLIAEVAPLVVVSAASLSARGAAYLVGFSLGSIVTGFLPIILTLISISGVFGSASTEECDNYYAEIKRVDDLNRQLMVEYEPIYQAWLDGLYKSYTIAAAALFLSATQQSQTICANEPEFRSCVVCGGGGLQGYTCVVATCSPQADCQEREFNRLNSGLIPPVPPPQPDFYNYDNISTPPDCPPNKKVWLQTMWASPSEFASQSKGCFLIGYSYSILDGLKIEYNPFKLPESFLISQALPNQVVFGDRFRGLDDKDWKNLESSAGWDKGYWVAEHTDVECRGWRPGWSNKVK
ncbi:hypothetical protein QUB11_31015 [Microcoleus sp. B6-A1]|uniref:hypothetical protein n=1 Tax=Microcoleus sp. B6-A1 TaxID=2818684 RepID=UPI002FD3A120